MAVWQFDLQLMPDQIVLDAPDCIDSAITKDGLDSSSWWLNNQHNGDYRQIIASVFAPLDSWSPDSKFTNEGRPLNRLVALEFSRQSIS